MSVFEGPLKLFHCYEIDGHRPLVVTKYEIVTGKGQRFGKSGGYIYFKGYSPQRFKVFEKFNLYPLATNGDYRTQAEIEGLRPPAPRRFRVKDVPDIQIVEAAL